MVETGAHNSRVAVKAGPFIAATWAILCAALIPLWPHPPVSRDWQGTLTVLSEHGQVISLEQVEPVLFQCIALSGIRTSQISTQPTKGGARFTIRWQAHSSREAFSQWHTATRILGQWSMHQQPTATDNRSHQKCTFVTIRRQIENAHSQLLALRGLTDSWIAGAPLEPAGSTIDARSTPESLQLDREPTRSSGEHTVVESLERLNQELTQLLVTRTEEHPEVIRLRERIRELVRIAHDEPALYASYRDDISQHPVVNPVQPQGAPTTAQWLASHVSKELEVILGELSALVEQLDGLEQLAFQSEPTKQPVTSKCRWSAGAVEQRSDLSGGMSIMDWCWIITLAAGFSVLLWIRIALSFGPGMQPILRYGRPNRSAPWKKIVRRVSVLFSPDHYVALPPTIAYAIYAVAVVLGAVTSVLVIMAFWYPETWTSLMLDPCWAIREWISG